MPDDARDDVSLREYLQQLINTERAINAAAADSHRREHEAMLQAIDKAADAVDARLMGMNEFRDTLIAQAATFPRREAMDDRFTQVTERADRLERSLNEYTRRELYEAVQLHLGAIDRELATLRGRAQQNMLITFIAVPVLVAVITAVLRLLIP